MHRKNHPGIFAPLALVYADGVGQDKLVQLLKGVSEAAIIESYQQLLILGRDLFDISHISVEDVFIVVVHHLEHLVPLPEGGAETFYGRSRGV